MKTLLRSLLGAGVAACMFAVAPVASASDVPVRFAVDTTPEARVSTPFAQASNYGDAAVQEVTWRRGAGVRYGTGYRGYGYQPYGYGWGGRSGFYQPYGWGTGYRGYYGPGYGWGGGGWGGGWGGSGIYGPGIGIYWR